MTYRENDSQRMLMGQSVLRVHSLDGQSWYTPYGHYGMFNPMAEHFALPISNEQILNTFCDTFSLERRSQPGLSLVIPMPDQSIDVNTILRAVVRQYSYQILSGQLLVQVKSNNSEPIVINGDFVNRSASSIFQVGYFDSW